MKANVENIEFEGLQNNEELEEDTDYTVEAKFDTPNVGKRKVTVKVTLKADSNIAKNYKLEKDTFEVEKEIIKSKHPTPVVKGVQSVSKNDGTKFTYTIEPLAGAKYKMDQGEWQDSNVFDGIEPASTHTFSAYIQGDANMEDSEVGTKENVQFNKLANKKPVFDVKVEEEGGKRKLTVVPVNFEAKDGAYSFGDNANYTEELSKGNYVTANTPKVKVYVKLKETAALNESEEVVQEVATDKLTPNLPAPEITNDKYDVDENDPNKFKYTLLVGAQLGIIEGYEYKKDDEDAWKSEANDYVFKGIEPNSTHTFYVRAKADANRNLAAGLTSMKTITFDLLETAEPKLEAEVTGEKGKKTITIKEVEKAQYKFGDDNWGNSNVKNNISDEKMEIGVRILGNATHKASKEVFKTIVVNEKENGGNANNGGSGNNGNAGSGSSSGGSSSGAYVPPVVAPKTEEKKPEAAKDNKKEEPIKENKAPETVPNNNISETPKPVLKVEAEVVSKGKAEANVSFADIENAIEAAKSSEKAIVKLAVETPKGTKATTVKLQEGVLKSVADSVAKALEITANKVKVQFESKALTFLTKKSEGEEVALSIAAVTKLNAKEKKIAGKRPVYDISLKTGDGKITSLGDGKAKISLPYAKKSKEKTSGLYAAYFNKNGKVVKLKVSYSAKTKLITFSTKNLTKYFIGYKASKKNK